MQGFNMGRYVPPDLEGTTSFNAASGKGHALGARARKLKTEGILTVRFECPFAIWCTNCHPEQIIGQGVRFNAEKKKVGNYYSTSIWSFRFKHTVCSGWIEVRTDPKESQYVVVDGGRRRDLGEDKLLDGEVRIGLSEEEKARLEKDGGFGALEKKVEDKRKFLTEAARLEELKESSEKAWADPYERSRLLRREFRLGRRKRDDSRMTGEALQEKLSLGFELVEEREEDSERAKYVDFGEPEDMVNGPKPMFDDEKEGSTPAKHRGKNGKLSSASIAAERKSLLQKRLSGNTRAVVDPFLREDKVWQPRAKRKKKEVEDTVVRMPEPLVQSAALVSYDSDSS